MRYTHVNYIYQMYINKLFILFSTLGNPNYLKHCNPEFIDSDFANRKCGRKGVKGGQHKSKSKRVQ